MVLVQAPGASLLAAVAVVLLVDAVELQQLLGFFAELRSRGAQLLFDRAAEMFRARFDALVLGEAVERRGAAADLAHRSQATFKASVHTATATVNRVTRSGTRTERRLPMTTPGSDPAISRAAR